MDYYKYNEKDYRDQGRFLFGRIFENFGWISNGTHQFLVNISKNLGFKAQGSRFKIILIKPLITHNLTNKIQ